MSYKIDKNKCLGCGACVSVCPHHAIILKNGKAEIDQKKCRQCGRCKEICPVKAIQQTK